MNMKRFFTTPVTNITLGKVDFLEHRQRNIYDYNADKSYAYGYSKTGTIIPSTINLTHDANFALPDNTLQNFTLEHNLPFDSRVSGWSYSNPTSKLYIKWQVVAEGDSQKGLHMPGEFSTLYPKLDIGKLEHSLSTFYMHSTVTYDDIINTTFKGEPHSESSEYYFAQIIE